MLSPDLIFKAEGDDELYFAHPHGAAWFVVALGIVLPATTLPLIPETLWRVVFAIGCSVLFFVGVASALKRHDLRLDLRNRTWVRHLGWWPSPARTTGSLDELQGLVLSMRWVHRRSGDKHVNRPVWLVSLEFARWGSVSIELSEDEARARELLEFYGKKMGLSTIDRTGGRESVTAPQDLDRSLAEKRRARTPPPAGGAGDRHVVEAGAPSARASRVGPAHAPEDRGGAPSPSSAPVEDPGPPPPRTRFTWKMGGSARRRVELAAPGLSLALLIVAVFVGGVVSVGGGAAVIILMRLTGVGWVAGQSASEPWMVRMFLALFGAGFVFMVVVGAAGRVVIQESGEVIEIFLDVLGIPYQRRRIRKREIEDVVVRGSTVARASGSRRALRSGRRPDKGEIAIKTDARVHTIGRELDAASQQWLADTLEFMASR